MQTDMIILFAATVIKTVWEFLDKMAKAKGLPSDELRKKALEVASKHDTTAEEVLKLIEAQLEKGT